MRLGKPAGILGLMLIACSPQPGQALPEAPRFVLSGQATGVPEAGLSLALTSESLRVRADGRFEFATQLVEGEGYEIGIRDAPARLACEIVPDRGRMPARDLSDLVLSCVPRTLDDCPTFDETAWSTEVGAGRAVISALRVLADGRILVIGAVFEGAEPVPALWWWDPRGGEAPLQEVLLRQAPQFVPTAALVTAEGIYVVGLREDLDHVQSYVLALDPAGQPQPGFGRDGAVVLVADPEVDCAYPGGSLRTVVAVVPAGPEHLWVMGAWATPCQVTRPWVQRLSRRELRAELSIYEPEVRFVWPVQRPNSLSFPQIEAAVADPEGRLILVGSFWAEGEWQAALRRFDAEANPDPSFGRQGVAALNRPEPPQVGFRRSQALGAALDLGQRVVVGGRHQLLGQGHATMEGDNAMAWRVDLEARADPVLPGPGFVGVPRGQGVPRSADQFGDVTVGAQGEVMLAGWRDTLDGRQLMVARLSDEGLDPGLGPLGLWTHPAPDGEAWTGAPRVHAGAGGCVWWAANTEAGRPRLGAFRRP